MVNSTMDGAIHKGTNYKLFSDYLQLADLCSGYRYTREQQTV